MTAPAEPVLRCSRLHAGYGSTTVVRDLDLEVRPGEIVALLGPNGAGKTTTVMTLAGALPALRGTVTLAGRRTTDPLHRRARQGLSLVTEDRAVFMRLTVAQNLKVSGVDPQRAAVTFPELAPHLHRTVRDLSGGQQQILAVARALGRSPTVLLADELSLGLAPMFVDRLLEAVRAAADAGLGVLVVEQHVRKILSVADRAVVLRRGRVALADSAASLARGISQVEAAYFAENEDPDETDAAPAASSAARRSVDRRSR